MLKLRRLDSRDHALRRVAAAWTAQGWQAEMAYPPQAGRWLEVADGAGRWRGWLEPRAWLESMAPDLAVLASAAGGDEQAARLIAACEAPLTWPMPEMGEGRLRVGALSDAGELPRRPLLQAQTAQGAVWLERAPEPMPDAGADALDGLPLPLSFIAGASDISLALLATVRAGDVLLIAETSADVRCNGRAIGHYRCIEEGIVMEWRNEEEAAREQRPLDGMGQLPVRLEFVLQQSCVTLDELRRLCEGELLPLVPDAERRVEVRANGALMGRGELVQMDGRLGVELAQWRGGLDDVE
ncbi:YscQ/HrcQ family type III secretion apparatus protein [Chromobacterium vaccinii]|uniref:YscQ/HrcQ family type III secretion apparatus protein n=1 Tax=Chromobacterium vaccinii TaxID=1108595 RepID=UPI003C72ADD2